MNDERRLERLIAELREWRTDEAMVVRRKKAVTEFNEHVRSDAPRAAVVAAGYLQTFSTWAGAVGVLDVLDGNDEGWSDINRAYHYLWWKVRISDSQFTMASDVALVLAHALAVGDEYRAHWLCERLRASFLGVEPGFLGQQFSSLGLFLINLDELSSKGAVLTKVELEATPATVYSAVLDALRNDPPSMERALLEACDYHLVQASIQSGYPQYTPYPYAVLPIEIQAIAAFCADSGRPIPSVKHPIMETQVAELPRGFDWCQLGDDEMVDSVVAKARRDGLIE